MTTLADIGRNPTLRARQLAACPPAERPALEARMDAAVKAHDAHRRTGLRSQAQGQSLEDWLAWQHGLALEEGLVARLVKVGPPAAFDRSGAMHPVGPGPADYQGQLPDGLSVAIEAKSKRATPDNQHARLSRSELTLDQTRDLDACADHHGLALLVYRHEPSGAVYAMPWREVPWSPRGGIGPVECAPWRVRSAVYLRPLVSR